MMCSRSPKVLGFYVAMMLIIASSNYLVQYPVNAWLTWGAISYPLSFLVTELATYQFGAKQARNVVYLGFAWGVTLSFWLSSPRIALASGTAFLISQLLDIAVFSSLRRASSWWFAPLGASVSASLIDTILFWSLAFGGEGGFYLTLALGDLAIKIAIDLGMLAPFRWAIRARFTPKYTALS